MYKVKQLLYTFLCLYNVVLYIFSNAYDVFLALYIVYNHATNTYSYNTVTKKFLAIYRVIWRYFYFINCIPLHDEWKLLDTLLDNLKL